MIFVLFLISLAVIYAFLLSFLSELTKPEMPESVFRAGEFASNDEQTLAA